MYLEVIKEEITTRQDAATFQTKNIFRPVHKYLSIMRGLLHRVRYKVNLFIGSSFHA